VAALNYNKEAGEEEVKRKSLVNFHLQGFFSGAQDWIRTSTSLRTLRPEHSASTNFATWAGSIKDGVQN
jgi:hypothetical protein